MLYLKKKWLEFQKNEKKEKNWEKAKKIYLWNGPFDSKTKSIEQYSSENKTKLTSTMFIGMASRKNKSKYREHVWIWLLMGYMMFVRKVTGLLCFQDMLEPRNKNVDG